MPIAFAQRPGLVAYLTVGDPDLGTSKAIALAAVDAGADVLELGVPFSDPLADGPVIQRASERAVARGTTLAHVLGLARELRAARPAVGRFWYFQRRACGRGRPLRGCGCGWLRAGFDH